jgi:GAF domain-containing protein/nitrogen-specific signal transduction histidine kinase
LDLPLLGERLRDIVEILNDIIDLDNHIVIILDDHTPAPMKSWHYLDSFEEIPSEKLQKMSSPNHPLQTLIQKYIKHNKNINSDFKLNQDINSYPRSIDGAWWIPLFLNKKMIGVISILYSQESSFPDYYSLLCQNIVRLGMKSIWDSETNILWGKLRYGILHRRGFLLTNPELDEIFTEYLDRAKLILSTDSNNIKGTIRNISKESSGSVLLSSKRGMDDDGRFRYWLSFKDKFNIEESYWLGIKSLVKNLKKKDINSWLYNVHKKFGNKMQDPDDQYLTYFSIFESKSHVVFPSVCQDQLVALFAFDSDIEKAFSEDQISAVAILAAHAASVIAMAQSRFKKEEQQKWLNIFHELRVSVNTLQFKPEEIFKKWVESIKDICNVMGSNMFLMPSTHDPSWSIAQKPLLSASTFGNHFDEMIHIRNDGLSVRVLKEGRPFWVNSPDDFPGINPVTAREGIKASLCLPMKVQDVTIGVLFVHYEQPHIFTQDEVEMLTLFTDEVSAILENLRLMDGIARVAQQLGSTADFESAMQKIAEASRNITRADYSSIFLWDSLNKSFMRISHSPSNISPIVLSKAQSDLTREIFDSGYPIKIDDTTKDPRVRGAVIEKETRSLIGVCLQMGDEKIGVLFIVGKQVGQFREYDLRVLQTLANQASLALGSRRRLLKPSMAIEESGSHLFRMESVLNILCEEIKKNFGFDFVAIQLVRPEERIIETVFGTDITKEWSGLAKHYLEEDLGLYDIQADIALAKPPRIEIISGPDNRFDKYIYEKFEHNKLVRAFIPMILVRNENGNIVDSWHEGCQWKEIQINKNADGWRNEIIIEFGDSSSDKNEVDYEIIGTVEVGYQNPNAQITYEQVKQLCKIIAQKTIDIFCASSLLPLLETFTKQAMECVGADSAGTYFHYNEARSSFLYNCCAGNLYPRFIKSHQPSEKSLGWKVLESEKPAFVPDSGKGDDDSALKCLNPDFFNEGVLAMAAFPIIVDDQRKGIIYINFNHNHCFTEDEINWVQLLSTRAAESIRRSIAHTQMLDRTRQMTALYQLGQNLARNTPGGDLLKEIAWSSLQLLIADVVIIYEYIEQEKRFVIPPAVAGRLRDQRQMDLEIVEHNTPALLLKYDNNVYAEKSKDHEIMGDPKHARPYDSGLCFVEREKIESSVGIILRVGEMRVGVMFINYRRYKKWSQDEKTMIETIASFAALAIRNARLFKLSEEGRNKLALLREIQQKLIEELDIKKDLDRILNEAMRLFGVTNGQIRLFNRETKKLIKAAGAGEYYEISKDEVGPGEAVSGLLINTSCPIIIPDVEKSEFFNQQELEALKAIDLRLYNFRDREKSFACLPLFDKQGLVGTLSLSAAIKNTFTDSSKNSLEEYCGMATVAIRNARVYEEAIKRIYKLERIAESSLMMLEDHSLNKKMMIILTAITIRGGLEFNRAMLFLLKIGSGKNELICEYAIGPDDEKDAKRLYADPLWEDLAKHNELLHEMNRRSLIAEKLNQKTGLMKFAREITLSMDDDSQCLVKVLKQNGEKNALRLSASDLASTDVLHGIDVENFILAPLMVGEEAKGVLFADNKFSHRPIDLPDQLLLKLFADQAAMAIQGEHWIKESIQTRQDALQVTSGSVAHVLNNVLPVISDRINRSLKNNCIIADGITWCKIALEQTYHAQEIVQRFLTFSLTEPFEMPDLFPVNDLVVKLYEIAFKHVTQLDVNTSVNEHPSLSSVNVKVNFEKLSHDIINFVRDSEKHKSSDLRITITCSSENKEEFQPKELDLDITYIKLIYTDNGPGIPLDKKERIFEPFFHVTRGGTGLGLAIAKHNAKVHGGTIIESGIPGQGVRFEIYLPVWKD